jgi:hypothetical protein
MKKLQCGKNLGLGKQTGKTRTGGEKDGKDGEDGNDGKDETIKRDAIRDIVEEFHLEKDKKIEDRDREQLAQLEHIKIDVLKERVQVEKLLANQKLQEKKLLEKTEENSRKTDQKIEEIVKAKTKEAILRPEQSQLKKTSKKIARDQSQPKKTKNNQPKVAKTKASPKKSDKEASKGPAAAKISAAPANGKIQNEIEKDLLKGLKSDLTIHPEDEAFLKDFISKDISQEF